MDDGLLTYNGELTDDGPLTLAAYGPSWRAWLLALLEILDNEETWQPGVNMVSVREQVNDLRVRLMGVEVMESLAYAKNISIALPSTMDRSTNGWQRIIDANQQCNVRFSLVTPVQSDNVRRLTVPLRAGSWVIGIMGITGTGSGKFRWWIDGVDRGSAHDLDFYSAGTVYNVLKWDTMTVDQSGEHEFTLKNVGKNASSSGYNINITEFYLLAAF